MYRKLWVPFLQLKDRYFKNREIPLYLCTDGTKEDIPEGVESILYNERANNNTNYLKRVVYYLRNLKTKYVLFWYDDMFLSGEVDWSSYTDAYNLMEATPNVKLVKLSNCSTNFTGRKLLFGKTIFQQSAPHDDYVFNVQPTLFDRAFLLDVLERADKNPDKNGPSDFETIGTNIAKTMPYLYFRSETNIVPVFHEGGVVRSGIVYPDAITFLQKEGIHIELFDKNCIYDLSDSTNTSTLNHQLKWELSTWFQIRV